MRGGVIEREKEAEIKEGESKSECKAEWPKRKVSFGWRDVVNVS